MMNKLPINSKGLWENSILASLAHAIYVAKNPDFSFEQSWDGINYSLQDGEGSRGTITFYNKRIVGAFRNEATDRASNIGEADSYLKEAGKEYIDIAHNDTFEYLLDEVEGKVIPLITTAFWGDDGLYSSDSTDELLKYSGGLMKIYFSDFSTSLEYWTEKYNLNRAQSNLLEDLFNRKVNLLEKDIVLSPKVKAILAPVNSEAELECAISFKEMNIKLI